MSEKERLIKAVRAALEREPRINLHKYPVAIEYADEVLTLEGDVANVAAKKLALELAAAVPGVRGIVDRLHVTPATHMGDGAVLDAVRDALVQEPSLRTCTLKVKAKGRVEVVRESTVTPRGVIEVSVTDGVVLLDDHVTSLLQKRIAGVLAWWVPGSRDVINGMAVEPPQDDSDREVINAVQVALKKDPFVNADRIHVSAANFVVTLEGEVSTDVQRNMAEFDAWYVFAVDRVVNRLEVRP